MFDALKPTGINTAAKELEKIVSKALKTSVERSIDLQFDRFLSNLTGDSSLEAALVEVTKGPPVDAGFTPRDLSAVKTLLQKMDREAQRLQEQMSRARSAFAEPELTAAS